MSGLLIPIALVAVLWFVLIRPQRAKAEAQKKKLGSVAVGDEILTVGGIYGIVQELESDEDGGDLVVEIAEGIHVRVARRAVATVIKPEADDADEDLEDDAVDGEVVEDDVVEDVVEDEVAPVEVNEELPAGEENVNDEQESVNPEAADETAPPSRS